MATWTATSDHTASLVTVVQWNNYLGVGGNLDYLKEKADAPIVGCLDGGANETAAEGINIIQDVGIIATVEYNGGTKKLDITLAASGGVVPTQTDASAIVSFVTNATINVKGSYEELIASTAFAVIGIYLSIPSTVGSENIFVDIGVGALGAEVVKIEDLLVGGGGIACYIPFTVAASARISIRAANKTSSNARTNSVAITIFG
jgi:hypothetical protein